MVWVFMSQGQQEKTKKENHLKFSPVYINKNKALDLVLKNITNKQNFFERISDRITYWTWSASAFTIAVGIILIWGISCPIFDYSDTWQLVINTGTTIITFLMVFLIQKTQNKDSKAIQLKLNELLAASRHASNRMVDIEDLSEAELDVLHKYYAKLSDMAEKGEDIHHSHSIDSAKKLSEEKLTGTPRLAKNKKNGKP